MIKLVFLAALAALYQSFRIGGMKLGDLRSDWPALSDVAHMRYLTYKSENVSATFKHNPSIIGA